jgi:hypothetical protein
MFLSIVLIAALFSGANAEFIDTTANGQYERWLRVELCR